MCEELAIAYELKCYQRDPVTILAPPELKALHPSQAAPVIEDGPVLLAESAAIVEYLIALHGGGRLALGADHPAFADYLYWFHFANGNLQPSLGRSMTLRRLGVAADHPVAVGIQGRLDRAFDLVERRLGEVPHLAGEEFTAADIMTVFSLTTMRYFMPVDLSGRPNILAYLQRIAGREAYRRAMDKGDPGMPLLLT